ncbi:hypothetical protein BH11MYX2_BH11MYX2_12560 [soil metagenome]
MNPAELGLASTLPSDAFSGTVNYAMTDGMITIADLADPLQPQLLGTVALPGITGVKVANDHLYATSSTALSVYGLADPAHPSLLTTVPLAGQATINQAFSFGYVWANTEAGLVTIDVDPPESAKVIGTAPVPLMGSGLPPNESSRDGRYLVLSTVRPDGRINRTIWDLSNPASPVSSLVTAVAPDEQTVEQIDDRFIYLTNRDGIYVSGP